jgi:hypothetical protein
MISTRAKLMGLTTAFLAIAPPASAHTIGGENGFETELLIPGVLLLVGSFVLRNGKKVKPGLATGILAVGILLLAASAVVPRATGDGGSAGDVEVRIRAPQDGATVQANERIDVEATVIGGELAESAEGDEGGHLHIFVDGRLQEMLYADATQVELEPGVHTITVEYTDAQHLSFEPPVETSVQVTAE